MKRLLLAASVALLLSSTAAFASPWHGGGGHGHGDHDRSWHGDNDDHHRHGDRNDRWRDNDYHDNGRHLGQYKHYRRGERLPVVYLQPRYYVNDWRAYRLAPPPRGYRWVRPADGHFLLVAVTTGIIADMLGY